MKINKVFRLGTAALLVAVLILGTASGFRSESNDKILDGCEYISHMFENEMDFTDVQKAKMKELKLNYIKEVTSIKNELKIQVATLNAASIGDDVNIRKVNSLIEEIGALKIDISKKQFAHKQSIRNLLSDDQKILFDARSSENRHLTRLERGRKSGDKKDDRHDKRRREVLKERSCVNN